MLMSIPSTPLNPRCNPIASHTFYPVVQKWVVFWIASRILYEASVMKSSSAWAYHFPQLNFCTKSVCCKSLQYGFSFLSTLPISFNNSSPTFPDSDEHAHDAELSKTKYDKPQLCGLELDTLVRKWWTCPLSVTQWWPGPQFVNPELSQ